MLYRPGDKQLIELPQSGKPNKMTLPTLRTAPVIETETLANAIANPREHLASRAKVANLEECLYFPKYFEIETVRACNADCIFCTRKEWKDLGLPVMTTELFGKITEELQDRTEWVERVCLSRNGEPLLDPHLTDRIVMLKKIGIREVSFSTNASLLDNEAATRLLDSGLDMIMFSFDANTPEVFSKTRRKLDFIQVRDNIFNFISRRNQSAKHLKIRMRFIETADNRDEGDKFLEFWRDYLAENDDSYIMDMHSWGNQKYLSCQTLVEKYAAVPCISPFTTMIILVNGLVPLCGADFNADVLLGDLRSETISKIWRGSENSRVRGLHMSALRNEIALCRGCNIWSRVHKGKF